MHHLHTPQGAGIAFLAVLAALLLAPFVVRFAGPKGLL
jgi:hypothetical protein